MNTSYTSSDQDQLLDWMRLMRSPGIGVRRFWQLWNRFGNIDAILHHLKHQQYSGFWTTSMAIEEIEWASHEGIGLVMASDPLYPQLLFDIPDKPPILYCKGNMSLLTKGYVAIVGGRSASYHGKIFARRVAGQIASYGWGVVSGLARGIDTEVHLGAGASSTIAVLAGGVDVCYPKQNQSLYDAIAQNGCIISEMPMGQAPARHLFHQRNRIIAAMAKATCVIEARRQSGSLITANFALEYGRDVFSAPGNPLEEHSKGCHDLLRQGALLMDDATDVMDVIGKVKNPNENLDQKLTSSTNSKTLSFLQQSSSPFKVHYQGLFDLLSFTPIAVEVIQQTTRMDLELLLHCLSELEMQSLIVRQGDQVYLNPS